ncbi:MAG: DNA-3-methyladenine glycosylase 2 family protein [Bacteroidota bacterium]
MNRPYSEIIEYYQRDKILHHAIRSLDHKIQPDLDMDIYLSLLTSIVSQQLSTKVARVIWKRFTDLFVDGYPEVELLLAKEHEILRDVGLSNNKARYIKNVAEFSMDNDISFEYLQQKTDEEIIAYLTRIKGVGKWTVQMILMFPMDRQNVFPADDLGIQKAMKNLYQLDLEKMKLKQKMIEISENWHPYKTLACKYLWKIID